MSEKSYELKAFAVDPFSIQKRTKYARDLMRDVQERELAEQINQTLGITITSVLSLEN